MHTLGIMHRLTRCQICCRELITSEIVYWLYLVLTGKDADFLSWPAATSFHAQRKQVRPGLGTLQDWVQDLLKKVVFKVNLIAAFATKHFTWCCAIQHNPHCQVVWSCAIQNDIALHIWQVWQQ